MKPQINRMKRPKIESAEESDIERAAEMPSIGTRFKLHAIKRESNFW